MSDRAAYIRDAREKYDSYAGEEWIRAGFDEHSGGYFVYHRDHQFDPTIGKYGIPRGDYEKIVSGVLVKYGMGVVLKSEISGYRVKTPEGYLNGILFDIKGVEGTGKNNIINDLKGASKKGVESLVLYYHDRNLFSEKQLREGYRFYRRNSHSIQIRHVYYIVDGKLHAV